MLLTIDIGNSDIVAILYNSNKEIIKHDRRKTIKENCLELYGDYVKDLKEDFSIIDCDYIVSCVVPSIEDAIKTSLYKQLNPNGHFVNYLSYPGISKLLDPPEEIGADLVAESVEAIYNCKQPTIIIDMGTATKVIVVDEETIMGVSIILGVKKTRDAIVSSIPHLPTVELELPKNIIGQNTIESIQSGIMFSTISTINGYTDYIEKHYGKSVKKIITGGVSKLFKNDLDNFTYVENLVNDGLFTIFNLLNK